MAPSLEFDARSSSEVMDGSHQQNTAPVKTNGINAHSSPAPVSAQPTASELLTSESTIMKELFSENAIAKIFRVAVDGLKREDPFSSYPEFVTPSLGKYTFREASFWTCGFFPGSLYALLERSRKYPGKFPVPAAQREAIQAQLLELCQAWSGPLNATATRTDTHDMGFIFQPSLQMDWELTGNKQSLQSVITAAESLASRFDAKVGAIRSWDDAINKRYNYSASRGDFLVIIDSMCNLDLLYYAGYQTGNQRFIDIATTHAHKVLSAIVRDDWSTYHMINFDAETGEVREKQTNQGYKDWSTWSRGQAWAILGFTQTYLWTKDPIFLHAAQSVTEYFLNRLDNAPNSHPYVPAWDFDAPNADDGQPLRDTSAGVVAANGLLLLHQITRLNPPEQNKRDYLATALRIVNETIDLSLSQEKARFKTEEGSGVEVTEEGFDAILMNATVCHHEHSLFRYSDTGLVYADYYFLEFGNKLLRMGFL